MIAESSAPRRTGGAGEIPDACSIVGSACENQQGTTIDADAPGRVGPSASVLRPEDSARTTAARVGAAERTANGGGAR